MSLRRSHGGFKQFDGKKAPAPAYTSLETLLGNGESKNRAQPHGQPHQGIAPLACKANYFVKRRSLPLPGQRTRRDVKG